VFIVLIIGFIYVSNSYATLCKEVTDGSNEIIIQSPFISGVGTSFWLWPDRNAIRFESGDLASGPHDTWLKLQLDDASGTRTYRTTQFYVYGAVQEDYLRCIDVSIKASQRQKDLKIVIKNVHAGFYDYGTCDGKKAWASFPTGGTILEPTYTKMDCKILE